MAMHHERSIFLGKKKPVARRLSSSSAARKEVSMAAAAASSSAAGANNDATAKLLEIMSLNADVKLLFDEADPGNNDGVLLAHSLVLAMHSSVIRNALDVEDDNKGREDGQPRRIPMPGSLKADFLKVAPFMYPVLPLPEVSWENLETLLIEGRKWDLAVVLAHADKFIQHNAAKLDMTAESQKFALKWLALADAAGLKNAVEICIDRIVNDSPFLCTVDRLQGLSPGTLQQLVVTMARALGPNSTRYCGRCGSHVIVTCRCDCCGSLI